MHTNAGVVTALQQAVAHLSSALETLTNTDINMLMCSRSHMDAWEHAFVCVHKARKHIYNRSATQAHTRYFF